MNDQSEFNWTPPRNDPEGVDPDFLVQLEKGAICPTCGQFAKIYRKRRVTGSMAFGLILIYRYSKTLEFPLSFIKVDDVFNHNPQVRSVTQVTGEFPKLRHWDLIKKNDGIREDGSSRTNLYRITVRGIAFVLDQIMITKYATIYNDTKLEFWGPQVTIKECLGKKFNYRELMGPE